MSPRVVGLRSGLVSATTHVLSHTNIANAITEEIIKLSQGANIVSDCGQGFPDFQGTKLAREVASKVIQSEETWKLNQYSPIAGTTQLKKSLENHWNSAPGVSKMNADKNILVTTSGTEAIYAAMQAIIDPGDEVIVFQPFFPWYLPAIRLAGGIPVTVTLNSPEFKIDFSTLEGKFTSKTRAIIFNTPHNPTGHVASIMEIEKLAKLCIDKKLFCVSDEVYENFIFQTPSMKREHHRIANISGMEDLTLTIGSASKMFSLTGWRVGWAYGPEDLIKAMGTCHGYVSYSAPTPFQSGVSAALDEMAKDGSEIQAELETLSGDFLANAKLLAEALGTLGVESIIPDGGYFLVCDVSKTGKTDVEFVHWLAKEKGVICVPMSVFHDKDGPNNLVRFAICKKRESIVVAVNAIKAN